MKHVSAKRVAMSMTKDLLKILKTPVKEVYGLMATGDNDFVALFMYCYPNLWKTIEEFHKRMLMWNQSRQKKKLSPVYEYDSPSQFLMALQHEYNHKAHLKKNVIKDGSVRKAEIESIRKSSLLKLQSTTTKDFYRERFKQHVPLSYADGHISMYYEWVKHHVDDIDTRYLIIHELAKYKCDDTIKFLTGLVRCEKNLSLQHYAWECLNGLGVTGVHKGRRPGKKKAIHLKTYKELNSPQDLLNAIYNSPLEKMKHYDLFLSHSYKDSAKLINLKDELNALGLNVYVDWVNDKDELLRSKTCAETAVIIAERMKICDAILYVHTESSLLSRWTPWELGFAYAKGKPILVYRPEAGVEEPEYLKLYTSVDKIDDEFVVVVKEENLSLVEYLKDRLKTK